MAVRNVTLNTNAYQSANIGRKFSQTPLYLSSVSVSTFHYTKSER